jgi:hypothetical protein
MERNRAMFDDPAADADMPERIRVVKKRLIK